jgi:osmotically-inducible protein OsmY
MFDEHNTPVNILQGEAAGYQKTYKLSSIYCARSRELHNEAVQGKEGESMVLSDEEIKKRIVDDLYWDSSIDASKVQVIVDKGKVILSGTVRSYSARNRATDAAYRIMDVIDVDNRLAVKYPPAVPIPGDTDIRETVLTYLAADPDMDRTDIQVSVKKGIVTLEGSVDEYWKRGEAERIVCRARGVCDIVDKLTVVPTRSIADKAIAADVRAAIERNSKGATECVTIEVVDGIVTLSGTVPTWSALRAAVNAAEFTRGVIDVIDDLDVVSLSLSRSVC